jgi:hypothetical protein
MKRSRRVIRHYQALVLSAVTLDALIDQELLGSPLASSLRGTGDSISGWGESINSSANNP